MPIPDIVVGRLEEPTELLGVQGQTVRLPAVVGQSPRPAEAGSARQWNVMAADWFPGAAVAGALSPAAALADGWGFTGDRYGRVIWFELTSGADA
jgi:hypothetical protein